MDNTGKRRASTQINQPWQNNLPEPTGTIDAADRQHLAHTYGGVLANNPVPSIQTLLIIDSVATGESDYVRDLIHTLTVVDTVSGELFIQTLTITLGIKQSVVVNEDHDLTLNNTLIIDDIAFAKLTVTEADEEQRLTVFDRVVGNIPTQTITASTTVIISDRISVTLPTQSLSHTLTVSDTAEGYFGAVTLLIISDSTTCDVGIGLNHVLTIVDNVTGVNDLYTLANSLTVNDSVVGYAKRHTNLCLSPTPTPQPIIILTFDALTLELRLPEFGNTQANSYQRVIRESRGGSHRLARVATWPKSKRLSYDIIFNKHSAVQDFLAFVIASVGKEVTLLDYNNRIWVGVIIPPENLFTHAGRSDRQITFEFEVT